MVASPGVCVSRGRKQTYAPDEALTTAARNFALPGSKVYLQDHAAGNRASNQVINGADNGAGSFGGHSTAIVVSDAGTERGATSAGRSLSARASVAGEGSDMELDCDDDEGALAPPTHGVYQMRYLAEDLELFRARCLQAMDLEERSSAGYRRAKVHEFHPPSACLERSIPSPVDEQYANLSSDRVL